MARPAIRILGHPFGPLGIARVARTSFSSLRAVSADVKLIDVWGTAQPDPLHAAMLAPHATREFGEVNIFHLNGDEIDEALTHLGGLPRARLNVISPFWELPRYPELWARQLERFDEVWAASRFIAEAVRPSVSVPVRHLPIAVEFALPTPRGRRYFGIPEAAYAFLFSFDLRSAVERKNPYAVIDAFGMLLRKRPWANTCLVIKVHGTAHAQAEAAELAQRTSELGSRVILLDRLMTEDEVHALIRACDAFVSLHRSEGFGLGLAEAMYLGRPVIGTGYSGNMDFMSESVSRLVRYRLTPVPEGAYPHWQDQVWAEPDTRQAAGQMLELYEDPRAGRQLGRAASRHMLVNFSFRAAGLRYLAALKSALG